MDYKAITHLRIRQLRRDLRRDIPQEERQVIRELIKEMKQFISLWEQVKWTIAEFESTDCDE